MTKANDDATFPGAYAREIITLAGRLGVTPEPLLEGLGMSLAELEKPQTRLGLEPLTRLVLRTIELTGEPGLAFYMGLHMRLSWHGFLGFAAMTAKNVREALSSPSASAAPGPRRSRCASPRRVKSARSRSRRTSTSAPCVRTW